MEDTTLLHRQIHPSFVQNNTISIQAFMNKKDISSLSFTPSSKDESKLSVYNGDTFTAEESYNHYTKSFKSCGVLSVSKDEITSIENLHIDDDNNPFNGHSSIDFSQVVSKNHIKIKAQQLRNFAVKRNWSFIKK